MQIRIDKQMIRFGSDCLRYSAGSTALMKTLLAQWSEKILKLEKDDDSVYLPVKVFYTEEIGIQTVESLKATKKGEKITFRVVHLQGDFWGFDWFTWDEARIFSDREMSSEEVFETSKYPKLFGEYDTHSLAKDLLEAEI